MQKKTVIDLKNCGGCKFLDIGPKDEAGYCRRYPPTVLAVDDGFEPVLPVVIPDDWCGEFSRKLQG